MRFKHASKIVFVLAVLLAPLVAVAQAPLHDTPLHSANFRLKVSTQDKPPDINRIHRWLLHLEDAAGKPVNKADIQVRGGMPEHNHGLPTTPKVTENLGQGDYLLEGMKFHMAGLWRIEFVITANDHRDVLVLEFQL